jgi:hypothetical protein
MPQMGFEPKTPVLKRVKMVHALDCAATVISIHHTVALTILPSNFLNINRSHCDQHTPYSGTNYTPF